jgi:hypothetical protein
LFIQPNSVVVYNASKLGFRDTARGAVSTQFTIYRACTYAFSDIALIKQSTFGAAQLQQWESNDKKGKY